MTAQLADVERAHFMPYDERQRRLQGHSPHHSHLRERHMSRRVFCALFGSLAFLTAAPFSSAAEKAAKNVAAAAAAREEVVAALKAEVAGENDRRTELLASAARTAPD